ncbi:glycine cleavage system H protein [Marinospirillum celere]|uniref:Glycine cleavage system H protein n=1 Tax=Marinospirillum celere TaxID=1122252 RepID=A0A1I1H293_9GAMM|nr:glycine cleavage system protein GcvH [Marinospirillum celere]SFC17886.1 glycine cleavage system H protein [Marinospirillum celere]
MTVEQRFCDTHQWVAQEKDNLVVVGISNHAQEALGDIVYVELPEAGKQVQAGEVIGTIESVKTASEIQAPVSGTLVACNQLLDDDPEVLNEAPLTTWVYRLQVAASEFQTEWDALMTDQVYQNFLEQ